MKDRKYEVVVTNMDKDFNTSIQCDFYGEFRSLTEAKKIASKVCKKITADKKNNSEWWQRNAPLYVAIDILDNKGDEEYPDYQWEDNIVVKEFRLN